MTYLNTHKGFVANNMMNLEGEVRFLPGMTDAAQLKVCLFRTLLRSLLGCRPGIEG